MKSILLTLVLFSVVLVNAQSDLDLPKTREVIVTTGDSMIRANVLYAQQKDVHTKDKSEYFWYHSNSIKTNKGAYYGKLLYGEYIVFDEHNNMVKRGEMNKGRKDGKWKEWYPNGVLKSVNMWKKGVIHGTYFLYNNKGELIEKGRYKKGKKLEEKVEYTTPAVANKVKYVSLKKLRKKDKPIKKEKKSNKKTFRLFKGEKEKKQDSDKKRSQKRSSIKEDSWLKRLFKPSSQKKNQ